MLWNEGSIEHPRVTAKVKTRMKCNLAMEPDVKLLGAQRETMGVQKDKLRTDEKVVKSDLGEPFFQILSSNSGPNGFIPNWRRWIRRPGSKPEHVTIDMDQVTRAWEFPSVSQPPLGQGSTWHLPCFFGARCLHKMHSHPVTRSKLLMVFLDIFGPLEKQVVRIHNSSRQCLNWKCALWVLSIPFGLHWVHESLRHHLPCIRKALLDLHVEIYITWQRWWSVGGSFREAAGRWEENYPKQERLQLDTEFPWPR